MGRTSNCSGASQSEVTRTYTYDKKSDGIYRMELDLAAGKLSEPKLAARMVNPSFLAIHPTGKYLYAVGEEFGIAGP